MPRLTRASSFVVLLVSFLVGAASQPINAQSSQGVLLQLLQPTTGVITGAKPEQHWTFNAVKGQSLSVQMQATTDDLDPYIQFQNSSGKVLPTSENASIRNAAIDDFIAPAQATYTVRATRAPGASTGGYTITLTPGFSFLLLNNPKSTNTPLRLWNAPNAVAHYADGKLELQLLGDKAYTYTSTTDRFGVYQDLYIQTE